MKKYVIVETDILTEATKGGFEPRELANGQAVLRVGESNEDLLKDYKKYTADEILNFEVNDEDVTLTDKLKSKTEASIITDSLGRQIVASEKASGKNFDSICSHDFCDKTTWFSNSTRVTGETLTATGLVYSSVNDYWIDLVNGKHAKEDSLSSPYLAVIYDDGVEITTGFTIDYEDGTVTLNSIPNGDITADYSYSPEEDYSSAFVLTPSSGNVIRINHAELDFAMDVALSIVDFEVWGYNPSDLPNKVMYTRTTYKNFKDILKIANTVEVIPALSGITNEVVRAVFDYGSTIDLGSGYGLELRIRLRDDVPMTGEFGTVTMYILTEDE